jgi:large subunit ribosomal protein L20
MRVKGGVTGIKKRKKILKQTEGFRGRSKNARKLAMQALDRALAYNYRDRKALKRTMRRLWITRITAAARMRGLSYSRLMGAMKKADLHLNRKILADLAATQPAQFDQVLKSAGLSF